MANIQHNLGKMSLISINYTTKYCIDFANEYQFTTCKKCINVKTGRFIKKVFNNGCIGYVIRGKFYSLTKLKNHLTKIIKQECPF